MVAAEVSTEVLSLIILAVVALAVVVWLVLTRVFSSTRAGRHAAHFLDAGDGDLSPQDKVKYTNQHPGAGGNG